MYFGNPIPELHQNKYTFAYIFVFVSCIIKQRPRGLCVKKRLMRKKIAPKLNFLNGLQVKKALKKSMTFC